MPKNMSDNVTTSQRHYIMSKVHAVNTRPELTFRRAIWRQGFRYHINDKNLPGKPDVVLPKYRTVIFIHGCFWHGHKNCSHFKIPQSNTGYWTAKIARNQERDQEVWRQLEAKGWFVIIVWECQLKKATLDETIESITAEIRQNGETHQQECQKRRASREAYHQERKARKVKESALMAEIKCQ